MPEVDWSALQKAAKSVRQRAWAPYSNYRVGAAITVSGHNKPFVGANVENASYGLTVCAERNAVAAAVAAGALPGEIIAVAVVLQGDSLAGPCGACRQVLSEFASDETQVRVYKIADPSSDQSAKSEFIGYSFGELLPARFLPEMVLDTESDSV